MNTPLPEPIASLHRCSCAACLTQADTPLTRYHQQINLLLSRLNEPQRRWYVGSLSLAPDAPTDGELSLITGLDEKTLRRGRRELQADLTTVPADRLRHEGAVNPPLKKDATLEAALVAAVEPHTAGDPMTTAKWLNGRLRDLQAHLQEKAHTVSLPVLSRLLKKRDYRLRANVKEREASHPPDRDTQFVYLQHQREAFLAAGQPVLSLDTKKKELLGDFKNAGRIWCQEAEVVNVHDFPSDGVGRAVPYGIYDLAHNLATVYVGQSADTGEFAVDNLAHWCATEMPARYPHATSLLLHSDCGGSNGYRCKLWKQQLQEKIADRFGLEVTVCHLPTGCSKWNPIEHRVFSEISKTWAGCPLRDYDTVLDYLRQTKTATGLQVTAHLVTQVYQKGIQIADDVMKALNLTAHEVCPQWNYTLRPRQTVMSA